MKRRLFVALWFAAAIATSNQHILLAQNFVDWTGGDGNYNIDGNWETGLGLVPEAEFDEVPRVSTAASVVRVINSPPVAGGLDLSSGRFLIESTGTFATAPGALALATGAVQINGGTFEIQNGGSANIESLVKMGGTMIVGSNVNFAVNNNAQFSNGILDITIHNGAFDSIDVGGDLAVGGSAVFNLTGTAPSVGASIPIFNVTGSVSGAFQSLTARGSEALGPGQVFVFENGALTLEQRLVVRIDMSSGVATLRNPSTTPIEIDGYGIRSALGSLKASVFGGSGLPGFIDIGEQTNHGIAELSLTGSAVISPGANINLAGEIYNPQFTAFGVAPEDYVFEYTTPDGEVLLGGIELTGLPRPNNLTLIINPTTGAAQIRNTSPSTVSIDGFTIRSENGSLTPVTWTPQGGDWIEIDSSPNQLGELLSVGELVLAGDDSFNLGVIFDPLDPKDLLFEFVIPDDDMPSTGIVVYGAVRAAPDTAGLPGDYNNDGRVDAADYTVWRNHLGEPNEANINNNGNGGGVTQSDYTHWKQYFGTSQGSGALGSLQQVPEPGTLWIVTIGFGSALVSCRYRKMSALKGIND